MPGPYAPPASANYLGVGKEVTRGTAVAPTKFGAYISAVDFDHNQQINRIMEAGTFGEVVWLEKIAHMPAGAFEILARPSIAAFFPAMLGGVDAVGAPVSSVYPHDIETDENTDYASIEHNLEDEAIERTKDSVIAEITWSASRDNPTLRQRIAWLGGEPAVQASPTAESYETEDPFVFSEGAFTIDGAGATNLTSFKLTWRMRYSVDRLTKVSAEYLTKVGDEVELEIEQLLLDWSSGYREVHYGSSGSSVVSQTSKTGSFVADFTRGAAGTAREHKLDLPALFYESAKYSPLDPGGSQAALLTRTAVGRKVAGSDFFHVTAKNLDSAAYVT
jgi:hypothetical protein